jgi:hypothetical protein
MPLPAFCCPFFGTGFGTAIRAEILLGRVWRQRRNEDKTWIDRESFSHSVHRTFWHRRDLRPHANRGKQRGEIIPKGWNCVWSTEYERIEVRH